MAQDTVKLLIPFESLLESVEELNVEEKRRLWELLDEQLSLAEEESWQQDPAVQAEIREARAAYEGGGPLTIDEYVAQQPKKN